jgi:hypothetical protein
MNRKKCKKRVLLKNPFFTFLTTYIVHSRTHLSNNLTLFDENKHNHLDVLGFVNHEKDIGDPWLMAALPETALVEVPLNQSPLTIVNKAFRQEFFVLLV